MSPREPEPVAPLPAPAAVAPLRKVDFTDVDDVIGIAAEMSQLDTDRLSVEDLEDVARQLDIPAQYVAPAITVLRERRAEQLVVAAKRAQIRRRLALGAAGVLCLLVVWGLVERGGIAGKLADAERAHAQVVNVMERQIETRRVWERAPDGPEKQAELGGAENRVRTERMRYDEVATVYNKARGGFPASLVGAIFGLPSALPLGNEIGRW